MRKKIIIAINVVVLLCIIGGIIYWLNQKDAENTTNTNTPSSLFPTSDNTEKPVQKPSGNNNTASTEIPAGTTFVIHTEKGTDVTVNNFYKNSNVTLLNRDNDAIIKDAENYSITYFTGDQSFFVSFWGDDLTTSRTAAENALVKLLGIKKEDSCLLRVSVVVPSEKNSAVSGVDYGLSFCPWGKPVQLTNIKDEKKIQIKTTDSGLLSVKDFYQSPFTKIIDKDNDAIISKGINYMIQFYAKYQSFNIVLTGGDLHVVREEAENAFLDTLGITKDEACQLYVSLGTPYYVNVKTAGVEYGLSFCPNGKPLPKTL